MKLFCRQSSRTSDGFWSSGCRWILTWLYCKVALKSVSHAGKNGLLKRISTVSRICLLGSDIIYCIIFVWKCAFFSFLIYVYILGTSKLMNPDILHKTLFKNYLYSTSSFWKHIEVSYTSYSAVVCRGGQAYMHHEHHVRIHLHPLERKPPDVLELCLQRSFILA